ncbi:MAG TPA: hypothetical protein VFS43_14940 [Polyangiaceae bacterium]|nr:hypothetical protein [Polyangiaceae bacterium]
MTSGALQKGLLTALRRDQKRDFASGEGAALLASKVEQVLATEGETQRSSGELPWRTRFGSGLHLLRHKLTGPAFRELARVYVRDALARWVPEAELTGFEVLEDGDVVTLRVRFRARAGAGAGGEVRLTLPAA